MKLKKIAAVGLSAAMIFTGAVTAFADDALTSQPAGDNGTAGAGTEAAQQQPSYIYNESGRATIAELNLKNEEKGEDGVPESSWILVKTDEENPQEIRLNISGETIFLDTQTGTPVNAADLKKDQEIYAYYNAAMTRSLPPQTHAQAILVNLSETHMPANLLTVESVQEADGTVSVMSQNGSIIVRIGADTPISPLYTKNIVRNTDIRMGTRIFAWYDMVALSMPGQAYATKVVILPTDDREVTIVSEGDIAIGSGKVENGVVMVPLKITAQKLGFTVTWDGKTQTVHLVKGDIKASVKLGEEPLSLGAAAYEVGGVSWAPAELFNALLSENAVQLIGNTLYL